MVVRKYYTIRVRGKVRIRLTPGLSNSLNEPTVPIIYHLDPRFRFCRPIFWTQKKDEMLCRGE